MGFEQGANGYLSKGRDAERLVAVTSRVASDGCYLPPGCI